MTRIENILKELDELRDFYRKIPKVKTGKLPKPGSDRKKTLNRGRKQHSVR